MPSRVMRDKVGYVSLFTREWIEIMNLRKYAPNRHSLPLYEGVD